MTDPNATHEAAQTQVVNDDDDRAPIRWRDAGNVPNLICLGRLAGIPFALWFAYEGWEWSYVALVVFLLITDLVDGRIARKWNLRTTLGARLDTIADIALYTSFIPALFWLEPRYAEDAMPFAIAVAFSYFAVFIACMARFRRIPSYHTRGAKIAWGLMLLGVLAAALGFSEWPLIIALIWVMLVNIEALLITFTIRHWRADVLSFIHALRARQRDLAHDAESAHRSS